MRSVRSVCENHFSPPSALSSHLAYTFSSPKSSLSKKGRRSHSPVYLLFFVLHPPEEVPCSEDRLAQRLCRIISHKVHISPYLQEILLPHTLMSKPTILGKMLSEVATIQYLSQQQLSSLFIHRSNHLLLRQSQHLLQNIHHRPCKLPQSQILQFSLHHIQSSRGSRISSGSRTDRSIRSYIPKSIPAVPSRTIWRDL